jgi:hypothetical protein
VLRNFSWLSGKVVPVSEVDLAQQRQSNLTNYLQFPAHAVKIHMVDSLDSLSFAASIIGLSLESDDHLDEIYCTDNGVVDEMDMDKKPAVDGSRSLRDFLLRGEDVMKGFRQVVGLDSEWRVVMYAQVDANQGASILQVSLRGFLFLLPHY